MAVKPTIQDITSTDWDGTTISPSKPVKFRVDIEIGDAYDIGADLFYVFVLNSAWILANIPNQPPPVSGSWVLTRGHLLLDEISTADIERHVSEKIDELGPFTSWRDFVAKLRPFLVWEFEGMAHPAN